MTKAVATVVGPAAIGVKMALAVGVVATIALGVVVADAVLVAAT